MLDSDDDAQAKAADRRAAELFAKIKDSIGTILDGPTGEVFREWLEIRGYAHRTTFHANERVHLMREGKRLLYLEIMEFYNLTPGQLIRSSERKHLR